MNPDGPVAVVTGGAGALGTAICRRLLKDGAQVVVADIDTSAANAALTLLDCPGRAHARTTDLADPASLLALVEWAGAEFGRIDWVVNNAAVNPGGSLTTSSVADFDAALAVNLRGPFLLCQAIAPYWQRQNGGRIVNIASRTWQSGGPPAYVASKAGLIGLTRSLAREVAQWNVTANAVAPSYVDTPFTARGRDGSELDRLRSRQADLSLLRRLATPDDVAGTVAFLTSDAASYITGEVIHVAGGSQLAPVP